MEPQNNYIPNQSPISVPPTNVPATKPAKSGKGISVVLAVVIALVLVGGLIYTNLLLAKSDDKISKLNDSVAKLDGLSGQLDQVVKTGANDKIVGFDKVDKEGYQSVFIAGGQVYFAKITEMTTQNMVIEDIYYMRVKDQTQPNPQASGSGKDISLVKLGCEIHQPEDKMTITRSNVLFWENLKDKDPGQVVKAITEYKKQNPDGQKCT